MDKTYLPYDPDQQLLLPAALREGLPENHLSNFISDVVGQLDLSEIAARYEGERRGGPLYDPRMIVKVLLYGYRARCRHRGASPPGCASTSPSGCWRPITRPISAPSRTFARTIWRSACGG